MKTSTALRRTKKLVWDGVGSDAGKKRYICHAANNAGVLHVVQAVVFPLLSPCDSLETWLLKRHEIEAFGNYEKIQATRHAWLDHLIDHYESIGD